MYITKLKTALKGTGFHMAFEIDEHLDLVAVDPAKKILFMFWGGGGKPNLISTKKLQSKDPTL